jgi:hypothetical protein
MSGLICDRSIMALAVAQQFHDRAWCSPAGDNRVTRSLNAGKAPFLRALSLRRSAPSAINQPLAPTFSPHLASTYQRVRDSNCVSARAALPVVRRYGAKPKCLTLPFLAHNLAFYIK